MLDIILDQIAPVFTDPNQLCWVERYTGLTRIAKRTVQRRDDTYETQTYPISCNVNVSDCWSTNRYKDLVPNDKYASLVYWEGASAIESNLVAGSSYRNHRIMSTSLNLMVWLNLAKLGKSDCSLSTGIFQDLLKYLNNAKPEGVNPWLGRIKATVTAMNSESKTRSIFNQYSYGSIDRLLYYPYELCSFSVDLEWVVDTKCMPEVTCDTPIDCIQL